MEEAPSGWPHRQKRSHAQMQQHDRSLSPAWAFNHRATPTQPTPGSGRLNVYHPPHPHDSDYHRDPIHATAHDPHLRLASLYNPPNAPTGPPSHYPGSARAPSPSGTRNHSAQVRNMADDAPLRYVGDGLDFRRPAGSRPDDVGRPEEGAGEEEVRDEDEDESAGGLPVDGSGPEQDNIVGIIDLTADDWGNPPLQDNRNPLPQFRIRHAQHAGRRLPRGMDIVIDLDSGQESWTADAPTEPGSPDIEFISARPLDSQQRQAAGRRRDDQDGDEVQFVREQALPDNDVRRQRNQTLDSFLDLLGTLNGNFTHLRAHVDRHAQMAHQSAHSRHRPIAPPRAGSQRGARPHGRVQAGTFVGPQHLDFEMVGFHYGPPEGRAAEPLPPTYEAPVKAPTGFTRSPDEKDVLVCPHCGDELCTGQDEVKKQVWIAKGCGHVYCGECTTNRSATKRTPKGKEKTAKTIPFKHCVVAECGKSVSNRKSMIQVFL